MVQAAIFALALSSANKTTTRGSPSIGARCARSSRPKCRGCRTSVAGDGWRAEYSRGPNKGAEVLEVRPVGGNSPLPTSGEEGFEEAGDVDGNKRGGAGFHEGGRGHGVGRLRCLLQWALSQA